MSSTTDNEQRFAYLLSPEFQIVNTAGKPLTGGWIEVYIHGTRVKYYCFSDFDGTLHPFQIPLDSLGSNIVLASPTHAYDIYIYNKFGALVMSRYNVVPACNAADIVEDVVVIDSPDETLNVTCDGGSNWHLTVNTDLIATTDQLASVSGDLQDQIDNKKDLQLPYVASGTVTKTITKIEQNENGEIEVTYEDIDLPPQVPNIDIISPSGTIDVSSVVNPSTNTKTFKIDIHKTKMDFFDGYCGKSHYEDRSSSSTSAFGLYVDQWDEYKYQGDFIANSWQDENNTTFKLNSGLYLITASIRYQMNRDYNKEEYIRIATGAYNGLENGTRYKDWSYEKELGDGTAESSIQVSFIRNVEDDDDYLYMNGNHDLYFYPYLPVGVNYAFIDHLQIVKLDSIAGAGGGSGPRYAAGYGIEILDDVIQVATGTVVTNNYFNTVVSSINNEINEINTTIQNVTGDITELNEAVTNIVGVTGDFATTDYVDAAVSGLENYSAGQYISIEDHVINVTGLQPEGDYATTEYVDNRIASAAGDVYEAGQYVSIENNVINVTGVQPAGDYATRDELNEVIETVNNVTGDITNINEAITNIIGATGDYATEEYVDEAIAAVSGTFTQQQSDWTQQDNTKVDYIKHKPREVNLVAGANIAIEQQDLDVIISATGIPSLEGYATEQYVDEAVSGLENYEAGQYVSIQNHVINVTGVQPAGDYATEQYVDEAVAAVTGQPFEQVNSDWLATSGVQEILNKPDVFQLIAGDNIDITPSGNDLVISASSDVTKAYVDEQIAVATGMIPEDTVTHTELNDAIDAATGMIPEAQVNADWLATSGKAEILNKPQEEAVEFEEVNLSDYALASAIPDVSNFVTQQDVDDSIAPVQSQIDTLAAATGDYLTEQVNADWNATSGVSEILNKPESEEVEFEEVNLADYALASAIPDISNLATKTEVQAVDVKVDVVSGKLPTTELGKFTIQNNVSGGPIEVLIPIDQGHAVYNTLMNSDSVSGTYEISGGYKGILFKSPGYDNDYWSYTTGTITMHVPEAITGIASIWACYASNSNPTASYGTGPNFFSNYPWYNTDTSTYTILPGDYEIATVANQVPESAGGYGKYISVVASGPGTDLDALSKISFAGVERHPELGYDVNLDRYYLGNTATTTSTSSYTQAVVYTDPTTKKQSVYLPYSMPTNWTSRMVQYMQYGSNYNSPGGYSTSQQYIAYKQYSNPTRYQYAYCTDNEWTNKKMTFLAYNESGEIIEKWTLDYNTGSSNVWTTIPISQDMSDYATEAELQAVSGALDNYIPYSASGVSLPNSKFEIDTEGQAYKVIPSSETAYNHFDDGGIQFSDVFAQVGTYKAILPSNVDHITISNYSGSDVTSTYDIATNTAIINVNAINNYGSHVYAYHRYGYRIELSGSNTTVKYITPPVTEEYITETALDEAISAVTGIIPSDVVTEQELADAIDAATGLIPDVSDLEADIQTVSGAVDAVSGAIPESEEVQFEELDLSIYALASAVPDTTQLETDVANLVAATGTYLTEQVNADWEANSGAAEILNKPVEYELVAGDNIEIIASGGNVIISSTGCTGDVTEVELATVSGTLEAEIQTVSAAIPDTSIYATETDLQTVSAAIPESESVEFEELDLSDYALASAIPDVSNINTAITNLVAATGDYLQSSDLNGYATEAYVDAAITGATFEQVNSDWNATSGVAEILNKPVSKEVEFREVDLSIYALASAIPDVTALETEIQTVSGAIPSLVDLNTAGITDVQVVNSLPASPVATVLYLIPEA